MPTADVKLGGNMMISRFRLDCCAPSSGPLPASNRFEPYGPGFSSSNFMFDPGPDPQGP